MNKLIALILLLPCMASAATDCHVIEYADHDEAICTGDVTGMPVMEKNNAIRSHDPISQQPEIITQVQSPPPPERPKVNQLAKVSAGEGVSGAHRRSRRDNFAGVEEAKAGRLRLIAEHQK